MNPSARLTVQEIFSSPQEVAADIAAEFRADATRWTQEEIARDAAGEPVDIDDPDFAPLAVCWCLRGAIDKREGRFPRPSSVYLAFDRALGHKIESESQHESLEFVKWNDAPGRTVAEVIELCEKVARS